MTEKATPAARGRLAAMGWRAATLAAAAAAATTGFLMLFVVSDPGPPAARYTVSESTADTVAANPDPLRAELVRCRTLPADADDARCQAAWEVNRRRFMGESRSYVVPVEPQPIERAPETAARSGATAPADIPTVGR